MNIFKNIMGNFERNFGTDPKLLSRKDDPVTSIEAGNKVDTTHKERLVYEAIKSFPDGCIADQVVDLLGLRWNSVTPRFKGLEMKGYIEYTGQVKKGASGRNQRVMRAVT